MAAPAIMRAGDRKSPGRSHGFAAPLVMGNPVAGNPNAGNLNAGTPNPVLNQVLNRDLNQARVARGG
jgi:hypothetical protein